MTSDITWGPVDWSAPIEAVHEDGRRIGVGLYKVGPQPDEEGDYEIVPPREVPTAYFLPNGYPSPNGGAQGCRWRIRNLAQPTQTPATAPSGGEVGPEVVTLPLMTEEEARALWYRSDDGSEPVMTANIAVNMLRTLGLVLPEPVDGDLLEARKLAASFSDREDVSHADYLNGDLDSGGEVQGYLAAIKRGRALQADLMGEG